MAKAKIITDTQLDRLLDEVARDSRDPQRDFVIVLLSCKAGLRACEIAGLTWRDVTDAEGNITNVIEVPAGIAKKGHARTIPMHPLVHEALCLLRISQTFTRKGAAGSTRIVRGARGAVMTPNTLQRFMGRLYRRHGLEASSHSGRRTVITKLARMANESGCSLFDVQMIAGHNHISSTEVYVEHSDNVAEMMRKV